MYHNENSNLTDYTSLDPSQYTSDNNTKNDNKSTSINIPICRYYNTLSGNWSTDGCTALWTTGNKTRCGCTHLTSFSLSKSDFEPTINVLSLTELRNITVDNLLKYPAALVTIIIILCLFWIVIICLPRANDKPIVSQMRPWSQLQHDKWIKSYDCKIDNILIEANIYGYGICYGLLNLSILDIRNNHYVLSILFRDQSTNWSGPQRIFCFLASMLTMASIEAAYFGQDMSFSSLEINVFINYIYASLFGSLVPMILSALFSYHRPSVAVRRQLSLYQILKNKWQERRYIKGNKRGIKLDQTQIEFDILGLMAQNDYLLNQGHKKLSAYNMKRMPNKSELLQKRIERQFCVHYNFVCMINSISIYCMFNLFACGLFLFLIVFCLFMAM